MKNYFNLLLVLTLLFLLTLPSCTVEKRKYTSGYHVDFHKSKQHQNDILKVDKLTDEITSSDVKVFDTPSICSTSEMLEDTVITIKNSIANCEEEHEVSAKKTHEIKKEKLLLSTLIFPSKNLQPVSEMKLNELSDNEGGGADSVLSWIAFAFAVLSIALVILATVVNGWAGLGYIAMALVAGVLTAVLSIIAKIITDRRQNATPWNLWFALAVGAVWAIITLRILFDRG